MENWNANMLLNWRYWIADGDDQKKLINSLLLLIDCHDNPFQANYANSARRKKRTNLIVYRLRWWHKLPLDDNPYANLLNRGASLALNDTRQRPN